MLLSPSKLFRVAYIGSLEGVSIRRMFELPTDTFGGIVQNYLAPLLGSTYCTWVELVTVVATIEFLRANIVFLKRHCRQNKICWICLVDQYNSIIGSTDYDLWSCIVLSLRSANSIVILGATINNSWPYLYPYAYPEFRMPNGYQTAEFKAVLPPVTSPFWIRKFMDTVGMHPLLLSNLLSHLQSKIPGYGRKLCKNSSDERIEKVLKQFWEDETLKAKQHCSKLLLVNKGRPYFRQRFIACLASYKAGFPIAIPSITKTTLCVLMDPW